MKNITPAQREAKLLKSLRTEALQLVWQIKDLVNDRDTREAFNEDCNTACGALWDAIEKAGASVGGQS